MNGSKPCGPSGGRRGPSPKRTRPRLSLTPQPSPAYVCSMVGTSRCDVRAACSGATLRMAVSLEYSFRPLLRGRGRRSAPSLQPLNTLSSPGQGESLARALIIRPSLVVVCLRNEGYRSGDCNRNGRILQRCASALPLLGERVGVGNEANSNPRRTTTPGTVKLRESPGRAGGFPI
jgi:hypothetical protein